MSSVLIVCVIESGTVMICSVTRVGGVLRVERVGVKQRLAEGWCRGVTIAVPVRRAAVVML